MQYILKRQVSPEYLPGWAVEPCSPFEVSGAVTNSIILCYKTAEALSNFFSHAGLAGWEISNLRFTTEFPAEFKPGDVMYFIFCPSPNTFQFWKGQKKID